MKKTYTYIIIVMSLICGSVSSFAPPCYWSGTGSPFEHLGGCQTNGNCGVDCVEDYVGIDNWACYQNGNGCCQCFYVDKYYNCWFGPCVRRITADRIFYLEKVCNPDRKKCESVSGGAGE